MLLKALFNFLFALLFSAAGVYMLSVGSILSGLLGLFLGFVFFILGKTTKQVAGLSYKMELNSFYLHFINPQWPLIKQKYYLSKLQDKGIIAVPGTSPLNEEKVLEFEQQNRQWVRKLALEIDSKSVMEISAELKEV